MLVINHIGKGQQERPKILSTQNGGHSSFVENRIDKAHWSSLVSLPETLYARFQKSVLYRRKNRIDNTFCDWFLSLSVTPTHVIPVIGHIGCSSYSRSKLKLTAHQGGEGMAAGLWGSWSQCIPSQEANKISPS